MKLMIQKIVLILLGLKETFQSLMYVCMYSLCTIIHLIFRVNAFKSQF